MAELCRSARRVADGLWAKRNRSDCLEFIEQNWTDIRPKSLRERLARDGSHSALIVSGS